MKADLPIIFSAPMVKALLSGRKTMTRRLAWGDLVVEPASKAYVFRNLGACVGYSLPSPWQKVKPDDVLWVRENFSGLHNLEGVKPSEWPVGVPIWYWADGDPSDGDWTRPRPSIFLPRWASRLTLEVTAVKIEPLLELTEADAQREGLLPVEEDGMQKWAAWQGDAAFIDPTIAFNVLWDKLHGKPPHRFQDNPEVVALTVEVHQQNIDAFLKREAA